MRTRVRLAALAVTCAAALSLTTSASAQTRALAPPIGDLAAAAGCERVIPTGPQPGANEAAGCFWGTGRAWWDAAVIGTFDSDQGIRAWLAWNGYPPGQMVVGSGWAAVTNGPTASGILAARLGGTVR
ncbi:MAG TPA: hypothetical protein VFY84_14205 [Jiangellales bacterium]|nr:hypothetical protein [Jiangellales bacterium]